MWRIRLPSAIFELPPSWMHVEKGGACSRCSRDITKEFSNVTRGKKKRKERKEIFQQLANVFLSFTIMRKVLIWKEIESSRDILSRCWMNESVCWKLKQSNSRNLLRRCEDSIINTCDVVDRSFSFHLGESVTRLNIPQANQSAATAREKNVRVDCHARDPTFVCIVQWLLLFTVTQVPSFNARISWAWEKFSINPNWSTCNH